MKLLKIGAAALLVGVGGGAFVSGSQVKEEILAQVEAEHAAADAAESHGEGALEPYGAASSTPPDGDHGPVESSEGDGAVQMVADVGEAPAIDPAHDPTQEQPGNSTADPASAVVDGPVESGTDGHAAEGDSTSQHAEEGVPQETDPGGESTAIEGAPEEAVVPTSSFAVEGATKLAKIFSAMQAEDAADVLQEMRDDEIEVILQHMSERQAAQILGLFQPARAAALSRVVLGNPGGGL